MSESKKFQLSRTTTLNIVSSVIMLVLVVMLFTPYWHYGDGQSNSINGYVWMPTECRDLETYFEESLGEPVDLNRFISVPILLLVLGVGGIALNILKSYSAWTCLLSIPYGLIGIFGFLCDDALRLGSIWPLHLVLYIAVLGAGLAHAFSIWKERAAEKAVAR